VKKLSKEENQKHKNNKYLKSDNVTFTQNLSSTADLQGWRNKLLYTISKIGNQNHINVCDFGSGLGDKAYLVAKLIETNKVYCLDYSDIAMEKSKEIIEKKNFTFISDDVNKSSNFIEGKSIDLGLMFGFLHEVTNVREVLGNVYPLFRNSGLLIISDNNLVFNYKDLHTDLSKTTYNFKILKVKKSLFTFYFGNFMFINYKKHSGRTDKLLAICSISSNDNIKLFLKLLKKSFS
jgi:ubiquinone/menaquinone biosynthesis C-methylase UbiE